MKSPKDLPTVFGENLKALRRRHDLTLDAVAKEARGYGVRWTPQRIAAIEAGKTSVTVSTVCTVSWTLSALTDVEVHPADLLFSDTPIEINHGFSIGGHTIASTLEGEVGELTIGDLADPDAAAKETVSAVGDWARSWGPGVSVGDARSLAPRISLADKRAAGRLGVEVHLVAGAALRLWGRLLSEEVDDRAGADASPQSKGHLTRKLEAELREVLEHGDH